MKLNFQFRSHYLLIIIILFLAAFLRLYRIADYMTFLGDEGRDALVVYGILHGKLTLLGPTASVGGFFLGPIYYYFMAPFLWLFNYNPVGPAVMVAVFGIITVWLVYKVGSEFFNPLTGIIAAFFYAISPVVVAYSRSSWNPNLMPFFSLLSLYACYKASIKNNNLLFIISGFLLGIALQLHYLTIFLGVVIGVYIYCEFTLKEYIQKNDLFKKKFVWNIAKRYFFVFCGFLLGWSPFIAFEVRHGFPNIQSIIKFVFLSGDTGTNSNFTQVVTNVFFRLFGRLITAYPPPEQVTVNSSFVTFDMLVGKLTIPVAPWYFFTLILGIFSSVFLLWKLYLSIKEKQKNIQILLLVALWFFVGISLFGFYKKQIYDYYFEFLFPLPFLLIAYFLSFLWENKGKYKLFFGGIFFILFLLNINGVPFRNPPNRQMYQVKYIADFVLSKTNGKPFNFAIISGGNSDHGYRYFLKLSKRDPVEIKKVYEDPNRTSVTDQLFVVCEGPCSPQGDPAWEIAGYGRAEVQEKWPVSVVEVYKLVHYTKDK